MTASRGCVGITELTPPVSGVFGAGLMVFTFIYICSPGGHGAQLRNFLRMGKNGSIQGEEIEYL